MVGRPLALVLALLVALPAAAVDPDVIAGRARNPLEGHEVAVELPALALEVGSELRATWAGPLVILVDGRPAARAELPPAAAAIPRRPWGPRDWLIAAGIGAGGLVLGAVTGLVAGLLR